MQIGNKYYIATVIILTVLILIFSKLFPPPDQVKITFPDGSVYIGQTRDGEMHGFGTIHFKNGIKYEGQWKNNKMDGEGAITLNGQTNLGRFKNNKLER